MGARLDWNDSLLVIESEAVRGEAVGCIVWLDLMVKASLMLSSYFGSHLLNLFSHVNGM